MESHAGWQGPREGRPAGAPEPSLLRCPPFSGKIQLRQYTRQSADHAGAGREVDRRLGVVSPNLIHEDWLLTQSGSVLDPP